MIFINKNTGQNVELQTINSTLVIYRELQWVNGTLRYSNNTLHTTDVAGFLNTHIHNKFSEVTK